MFSYVILIFVAALHLALAVAVIVKYMRTRDVGFIWLGIAVVIWPIVSRLLDRGVRMAIDGTIKGHPIGVFPFTSVDRGEISIGNLLMIISLAESVIPTALLLIAVFCLCKARLASDPVQNKQL